MSMFIYSGPAIHGGLPAWVPALNTLAAIAPLGISAVDPGTGAWDPQGTGNNSAVYSAWNSGTYAPDYGTYGAFVVVGGGDHDRWGNDVYLLDLNAGTPVWARIINPSSKAADSANFDTAHGEYSDGTPGVGHTYGAISYLPPSMGGGTKGSLIQPVATYYKDSLFSTGTAHRADLNLGAWFRASNNQCASPQESTWCLDTTRSRFVGFNTGGSPTNTPLRLLDTFSGGVGVHSDAPMHVDFTLGSDACCEYDPVRDMILGYGADETPALRLRAWTFPNYTRTDLAMNGSLPLCGGAGFCYCSDLDCFFMLNPNPVVGSQQIIYKITPNSLANPWTITPITMAGVTVAGSSLNGMWGRLRYASKIKSLIFGFTSSTPTYVYRVAA